MPPNTKAPLSKFYVTIVLLLMLVLPVASVIAEHCGNSPRPLLALTGKWFVFWAIGVRLFTAGLKQAISPAFTAKDIFHLEDEKSYAVVRELGFANICLGTMGILSLSFPDARMVAAIAGGLYFGIAGIQHIIKRPTGPNEWVALVSDLFIFIVVAICVINAFL